MKIYEHYHNVACIHCGYPECKDAGIWGEPCPPGCNCRWKTPETHAAKTRPTSHGSHPVIHKMECPRCDVAFAYCPDQPTYPGPMFFQLLGSFRPTAETLASADARYLAGVIAAETESADIADSEAEFPGSAEAELWPSTWTI